MFMGANYSTGAVFHATPERKHSLPRCKSCRLGCLRCSWTNYFEFCITAIAKFAPVIPTYSGSSFHDEVGTCYCRQIRHLIVNDAFKWAILRVRYSRTDLNTGTSHLMSMSSSFKLYRMFLLTKCFVICEKWLWNVLLDCFKLPGKSVFSAHKQKTRQKLGTEMAKWLRCQWGLHR